MPPKTEKVVVDVVDIVSSDDEECVALATGTNNPTSPIRRVTSQSISLAPPQQQLNSGDIARPLVQTDQNLESRSFWKAGNYALSRTARSAPASGQLEHARVHPKFLHSNATSHKWAFGAIAELLDNAVDEIHNGATFVKVDKFDIIKDHAPALIFQDDGGGMDPEGMRKCMSLGYSSKKSNTTIGQYGNGFKTSTMRLGSDVIVFSRATHESKATQSVGLLSYTFLRKTGQDDVIVPMIDFDVSGQLAEPIIYGSQDDWYSNLKTILEWSPFASKEQLMQQFEDIGRHGTKIIIYNLWLNDEGIYELSFDDDDEDIRLRDEANGGGLKKLHKRVVELQSHISYRLRFSLRAYASILYLRKFINFSIILRGKPVQQLMIADELKYSKVSSYKPNLAASSKEAAVETTIGFIKEAPALSVSGFNVYNKNRLIRPFWKVTAEGSSKGHGVVGVLEANFIEPAHDKQDFERSSQFIRLEARLKQILSDYWKNHCHLIGLLPPSFRAQNMQKELPRRSGGKNNLQKDFPVEPTIVDLEKETHNEVVSEDGPASVSVDQICEENIQLFLRCEEFMKKETEMKEEIVKLEKELEAAKRKRAQLSSIVDTSRKQNIAKRLEKVS
ncbi:protein MICRORCHIDIA 2-like [Tripterygium wilfordii]|uniref:protein MICRORCHIDIA 2-like n=1 Tax=Tripterygium wilfordii TaxID=458696 RepID=UPI0018F84131|nr:protein MICRORCHIDIA 2-like [Tripterygium wilfordii]